MAALILPSRRVLLPQQGVALNREKIRETGTIYLGLPGAEFRDLVGGASLTNPGGLAAAEKGRVATFNGAQQANKALTLPNGYRNVIIAARIRATAAQAGDPGAAFGIYNGTAVQSGMGVGFDPSNNVGLAVLTSNAAALPQSSPGVIGKWYTVFVQYEGAATNGAAVAYVDGRRVATGYGAAISGATDPANEISIGAQHRSSGFLRQFKGDIEWAALMYLPRDSWQSLTDEVALRLYESGYPYNLLKPIERRIMVAVSSGGAETSLTVAEASHGHTSDSLSLTTATALTAADSTHAHAADGLTLSTGTALVVAEASHAHTAGDLTLSTGTSLAVGDALHSHTADAPALTTNSALAVVDASHGHTAENLTLSAFTGDTLAVQDATHAHSADAPALTTDQHLAVGDAAHAHAADALALSTQILLTVSDAAHAHSVDNLTLSDVPALVIASVMHAHAADSVALTSQAWLAAQDALHAHQADNVSLSAFDADDKLYPLAGLTQEWPRTGSQTFPLAGLRQNFPLE